MSTYIRQSTQSYKGFIYGKLTALTQQPQSDRKSGSGWEIRFSGTNPVHKQNKKLNNRNIPTPLQATGESSTNESHLYRVIGN